MLNSINRRILNGMKLFISVFQSPAVNFVLKFTLFIFDRIAEFLFVFIVCCIL